MTHLHKEEQAEGIVLRSIPFKDHDRILTLFTKEAGLISLMVKRVKRHTAVATPFCQAEYLYTKSKSDLYRFHDATVLDDHLPLREKLQNLQAGGHIGHAILHSQLPGKPAPKLYQLLVACLKQIPHFPNPHNLVTSFQLKLLTHEGVVSWEDPSLFPIALPKEEWNLLYELAHLRSFQKMREVPVYEGLSSKIQSSFKEFL